MSRIWQWIFAIAGIALSIAFWRWQYPQSPALYSLRVQVIDPAGNPVRGAALHVSAGNEPHLLQDGWWEVQIPRAKAPQNGRVTLWVEHPEWAVARATISLGDDPQPSLELKLATPQGNARRHGGR